MVQALGFIDHDHPNHVCKLCKAIYGLKQALWAWYQELHQYLVISGFTNSHADTSLFVLNTCGITIYLLVYVDDIIIIGDNDNVVECFITLIAQQFSLKDLQPFSFLGVEVIPYQHGLLCLNDGASLFFLLALAWLMPNRSLHHLLRFQHLIFTLAQHYRIRQSTKQ